MAEINRIEQKMQDSQELSQNLIIDRSEYGYVNERDGSPVRPARCDAKLPQKEGG
jgi:hypothetical protein